MRPTVFSGEALPLYDSGSFEAAEPCDASSPVDAAALRRLVTEHHGFVWRSLVRLGVPRADVDDAVQQVSPSSPAAWPTSQRAPSVRSSTESASVWRRVPAERRRAAARSQMSPWQSASIRPTAPTICSTGARARDARLHLGGDAARLRSVFTLFDKLQQLTMAEIAELLQAAPGSLRACGARARPSPSSASAWKRACGASTRC